MTVDRRLTVLDAPSNLGLRPPRPGAEPGVRGLATALLNDRLNGLVDFGSPTRKLCASFGRHRDVNEERERFVLVTLVGRPIDQVVHASRRRVQIVLPPIASLGLYGHHEARRLVRRDEFWVTLFQGFVLRLNAESGANEGGRDK